MMAALIIVEDLIEKYGFTITPTQRDKYTQLIATATAACERHLQRDIGAASFTEYFDGGSQERVLSHSPVTEMVGIYVDSTRAYATALEATDYRLDNESGILIIYGAVPLGRDVVKVSYKAGMTVTDDILWCIAMTVQHLSTMQQADLAGVTSRTTDGGTVSLDQSIPPLAVQRHLATYRRNLAR
jgi:hypothetical protein